MKYKLLLLFPLLALAACAPKAPAGGALILGEASGLDPDDRVYASLSHHEGEGGIRVQVDTLRDGRFSFRLDSLPPDGNRYQVILERHHDLRHEGIIPADVVNVGPELYLEPGVTVRIKGEAAHLRTARIDSPVRDQQLRERFIRKMSREDWNTLDDIQAHRYHVMYQLYGEEHTPAQQDSLRKLAQQDLEASNGISERLSRQRLQLLETEEIGQYALEQLYKEARFSSYYGHDNRKALLRLYERLSDDQKATREGMEMLQHLNPVKTVSSGDPVPAYDYVDQEGKTVRLSGFAGKWVLVDFWSNGCGPCLKAVPELGAVSREFQDRLEVVSISLDKERIWKEASAGHGISWHDWNDPNGSSGSVRAYGTNGIPTFVLISPEGIIHDITVGYGEGRLRRAVRRALDSQE